MPVFHTKTIESILDPVAQQVSRLVIIHEDSEAGHEMPDLVKPVQAVSKAVHKLAKVGQEMIQGSEDAILIADMPTALTKVKDAAELLEGAAFLSSRDPMSKIAREKLIDGSRLILQGTSNVLLVFDESEVRKLVNDCNQILDYLAVAEVIETIEDLVQFVKDLSPSLSKVTHDVERRIEDLTHQIHRETLGKSIEQVKTLAPILICSMKILIQILVNGGNGVEEASENRNYLTARLTEEVLEIIRVLQLTTYDEDEWNSDNHTVMKRLQNGILGKYNAARDWLYCRPMEGNEEALGNKSLRQILELSLKLTEKTLPRDAEHLKKLVSDIQSMANAFGELGGSCPQSESLAKNIDSRLRELMTTIEHAVNRIEKSGVQHSALTLAGKLEQARRWLEDPFVEDRGLGTEALQLVLNEGYKLMEFLPVVYRDAVWNLGKSIQGDLKELTKETRAGNSVSALRTAKRISGTLNELNKAIQSGLTHRIVEDFKDLYTPLKQFSEVVHHPSSNSYERDIEFKNKSAKLFDVSERAAKTAKIVATAHSSGNKKLSEKLLVSSHQVEALTPQLISAGRIRMVYPENSAANEHFENLKNHYSKTLEETKAIVDEAIDFKVFVRETTHALESHSQNCFDAIREEDSVKMIEEASSLARLTNRLIQVLQQEAENSEDAFTISKLTQASEDLQIKLPNMVKSAREVALHIQDPRIISSWNTHNKALLESVVNVRCSLDAQSSKDSPPLSNFGNLSLQANNISSSSTSRTQSFTEEELSDIFQINFSEIFGSPDSLFKTKNSNVRGIHLPETREERRVDSKEGNCSRDTIDVSGSRYSRYNSPECFHGRSASANGRTNSFLTKANNSVLPKALSSENLGNPTKELLEHTSVKDLVKMIERNTKSESENLYVRKWGCDLISSEPRSTANPKTCRREKKNPKGTPRPEYSKSLGVSTQSTDSLDATRKKIDYNSLSIQIESLRQEFENEYDFLCSTDIHSISRLSKTPLSRQILPLDSISDDEGTYEALSLVYQDSTQGH